jgi:hypothetical protein
MKRHFALCVVLLCSISEPGAGGDEQKQSSKRSEQAEKAAASLRRTIPEEIKTLGNHEWAGQYYEGDGMGVNVSLILAPKSGYLFEWHGCGGLYDRNYGAITWNKGRLRLSFTFPNKQKGFQGIAEEFVPIAWGDRKYLIPTDDIVGFCNEVNDGSEPRKRLHGFYLLRRGDEKKEVKGFPAVPGEFKPYLLARPIEAEIVGIGKTTTVPSWGGGNFMDISVTLNRGKKQGLLVGMKLHVVKPENAVQSAQITKVEDERSEAVMTQVGGNEERPRVGWRLSTRCPWHSN